MTKKIFETSKNFGEIGEDILKHLFDKAGFKLKSLKSTKHPDFQLNDNVWVECKIKNTAFRKAKKYVGLKPEECLTIDMKKVFMYLEVVDSKYTGCYRKNIDLSKIKIDKTVLIALLVDYRGCDYETYGLYIVDLRKLLEIAHIKPKQVRTIGYRGKTRDCRKVLCFSTEDCHKIELDDNDPFSSNVEKLKLVINEYK